VCVFVVPEASVYGALVITLLTPVNVYVVSLLSVIPVKTIASSRLVFGSNVPKPFVPKSVIVKTFPSTSFKLLTRIDVAPVLAPIANLNS